MKILIKLLILFFALSKLDLYSANPDSPILINEILKENKENAIKLIQSHKVNINYIDKYCGCTALHVACKKGLIEIAKLLLENGANTEAKDIFDYTPLLIAAKNGFYDLAALLLEYGANVNAEKDNWIALTFAESKGFENIANLLHIWPTIQKYKNELFEAYEKNQIIDFKLCLKELMQKTFNNKDIFLFLKNDNKNTLLHEAIIKKDYKLMKVILNFNPKIVSSLLYTPNKQNMSPIDLAVNDTPLLTYFMNFAYPPAARKSQPCIIS